MHHLPAVKVEVSLQEMVEAIIATDLQLRTDPERAALLLGLNNGLDDPFGIAFKVKSPLVEVTRAESDEHHLGSLRPGQDEDRRFCWWIYAPGHNFYWDVLGLGALNLIALAGASSDRPSSILETIDPDFPARRGGD